MMNTLSCKVATLDNLDNEVEAFLNTLSLKIRDYRIYKDYTNYLSIDITYDNTNQDNINLLTDNLGISNPVLVDDCVSDTTDLCISGYSLEEFLSKMYGIVVVDIASNDDNTYILYR